MEEETGLAEVPEQSLEKPGQSPEEAGKGEALARWIIEKLKKIPVLGEYLADVPALFLMVSDYARGRYRAVPLFTILGVAVALVYFLSPVDLIPDLFLLVGQLDDAAAILLALNAAHEDIKKYKKWKQL